MNEIHLRSLRIFIVHNWFSLWVSTYKGFSVSDLQGLASNTAEQEKTEVEKP